MAPQMTYVVEENLEIVKQIKITHPSVDAYFENYDGSQYLARPWLKEIYPKD
jgi:hemimethylated DNA binding protein